MVKLFSTSTKKISFNDGFIFTNINQKPIFSLEKGIIPSCGIIKRIRWMFDFEDLNEIEQISLSIWTTNQSQNCSEVCALTYQIWNNNVFFDATQNGIMQSYNVDIPFIFEQDCNGCYKRFYYNVMLKSGKQAKVKGFIILDGTCEKICSERC